MADRIQLRRDTSANWSSVDPTLSLGEVGIETDTLKFKVGDGSNNYNALDYFGTLSPDLTGIPTAPTAAAGTSTTQLATTAFTIANRGDRYLTTSTTSNSVANGTKTFTVQTGLSYTPTQDITIVYDNANHMHGTVTSYDSGTGIIVIDVSQHTGSGTYTAWTINVGGLTTAAGALLSANNLNDVASTSSALTNLGGVPTSRTISAGTGLTGGGDLTANRTISIGTVAIANGGTGATDASAARSNLGITDVTSTDVQIFTANGTWTKPAGAKSVNVQLFGGGGGGGGGRKNTTTLTAKSGGGGGGGGGYLNISVSASALGATESVAIGAGGTSGAGTAVNADGGTGGTGGNTTFNSLICLGALGGGIGRVTDASGGSGILQSNNGGGSSIVTGGTSGAPTSFAATNFGGAGGGGGGSISATSSALSSGNGGRSNILGFAGGTGGTNTGGVGNAGTTNTSASAGLFAVGSGGGGGGSGLTVSGGVGGNGGFPAGGGGGGGATETGATSGAGGVGGAGLAIITTYF